MDPVPSKILYGWAQEFNVSNQKLLTMMPEYAMICECEVFRHDTFTIQNNIVIDVSKCVFMTEIEK